MSPHEVLTQAVSFHKSGELRKAQLCYEFVLKFEPANAEALRLLGSLLLEQNALDQALPFLQQAHRLKPGCHQSLHALGRVLRGLGRLEEAMACFRTEVELQPDDADAWSNLGWTLRLNAEPEEALVCNRKAVSLRPDQPEHWNNLGIAAQACLLLDEALQAYRKAHALRPDYAKAYLHEGMLHLLQGDWSLGWPLYEYRFGMPGQTGAQASPAPLWDGSQPLDQARLLLRAEQGLGDTLQFIRYAGLLHARGAILILEVQAPLVSLLQQCLPWPATVLAQGASLPPHDLHCPLLSLPHRLGTTPEQTPFPEGYLRRPPGPSDSLKARLHALPGPRIGIVWSGNARYGNDRTRSIPLRSFLDMPSLKDASLVVVQKELNEADRQLLSQRPNTLVLSQEIGDFLDTATMLSALDDLETVDTSVGHLAGALGLQTRLHLPYSPDWRWGLNSSRTPWYLHTTLVRRPLHKTAHP